MITKITIFAACRFHGACEDMVWVLKQGSNLWTVDIMFTDAIEDLRVLFGTEVVNLL